MRLRFFAIGALVCAATAAESAAAGPSDASPAPVTAGVFRGASIATRYDVSPPLRSIRPVPIKAEGERDEYEDRSTGLEGPLGPQTPDAAVQSKAGPGEIPSPTASFDGPSNLASVSPPDPVGDVGPNHYVAMSNLYFAVYNKTGSLLYGPAANNTLWAGFGGPCQTENAGDPIVLYDQLADRWILTQFTSAGPTFFNCVAVSTTPDPTGTYYRYAFTTGTNFPDYPKYGIWADALYISTREFAGVSFAGVGAYAINRAQILAGNPAAQMIVFLVPPGGTVYNIGDGLLPADLDGTTLPPAGSPEIFIGSMDLGGPYGAPQDALSIWRYHVDFVTPANSTFTLAPALPVAAFDSIFPCAPGSRDCIPQPVTGQKVDILSYRQRVMHRLAYRNFGTHESLVTNQSVEASAGIAGVRWYEIRDPNGTPTLHQQGTYAPGTTDGIHRWMGSIAMDAVGDIALGYSASNAVTFPSSWYTGRLSADPLGTLPQGEGSFVNGTGSQTGSARWGDYTSMNVDPVDDCTFWYVNQYIPVTSSVGWRLRIGSFKFPGCVAGPSGTLQGQVTVCGVGSPLAGASVSTGLYGTTTDGSGNYSFSLPPGDYAVTITAPGYASGGGPATITDGGTTVLDACLTGVPVIETAGATLLEEGCEPGNGAIDPGETVTMRFCVRNTGAASTTNLVGDLDESGGIGDAPDPAVFGAVLAGGPDVCADVTFTASEALVCGDQVTPLLDLEDGATELGGAAFGPFLAGTPVYAFSENLDGVSAPALPGGWTTATTGGPLPAWVTSTTTADSPPNALFTPDPNGAGAGYVNEIVTPSFAVTSATAALRFRHNYNLEDTYDGGVLEISIGGGPFQDILAAGGAFVSGGYTDTLSGSFQNPLAGRQAWSGISGAFVTTEVTLPAAAAGQNVQLKWRCGVDLSISAGGWYVDSISVQEGVSCCTPIPEGLEVDPTAGLVEAPSAASNGVWEPGENVLVQPTYFNGDSSVLNLTGSASNLTGPAGATYTLTDATASYGSIASNTAVACVDCYQVSVDDPAVRPAEHWDATMLETLSAGSPKTWTLHIGESFPDVPDSHIFYAFIETILHKGVTGGCGATNYCPGNPALRKQMAVFLLKSRYGAAYTPPPAVGLFSDVPQADPFAPWIEDLYNRGITGGCSQAPLSYCPNNTVLRQQMAVFLLKTLEGSDYTPPDCSGVFNDVPCPSTFADWIEELADRNITGGCGSGNFCPAAANTRGQMAVFLTKTFRLALYGP